MKATCFMSFSVSGDRRFHYIQVKDLESRVPNAKHIHHPSWRVLSGLGVEFRPADAPRRDSLQRDA